MTIRLPLLLKSFLLCLLAGGALLNCANALAQSSGSATIAGVLTDPSGRAIGGARIVANSKGAGQGAAPAVETQSHDDGSFTLALAPGKYTVAITRESFAKVEREIDISSGQKVEWKLTLEIEALAANMIVTAQTKPVEATSTTVPVTVVTREEIDQREATSVSYTHLTLPTNREV